MHNLARSVWKNKFSGKYNPKIEIAQIKLNKTESKKK